MKPILFLLLVAQAWSADLKLAGLFTDHMVLQRDQAAAVWGSATPGDEVTVLFGDQKKVAKAAENGRWTVKLDPMAANAVGRDLVVQCTSVKQETKLTDIVVGDVWLCSGQSNMHFQMKSVENAEKEIAEANQPAVRFFTVEHQFVQKAAEDVRGAWKPVSPQTAADCSAVACYFGMALQPKIGVPLGLIVSSVGGTRIETWMRPETLAATGEGTALIEKWKAVSPEEFEKIGTTYREFQR